MEVLFRAFDGKIFEDEDKCRDYELNLKFFNEVKKEIIFLNCNDNLISKPISEINLNDVCTVAIGNEKAADFLEELFNEAGFYSPENGFTPYSVFWWDDTKDKWINVEEEVEILKGEVKYLEGKAKLLENF